MLVGFNFIYKSFLFEDDLNQNSPLIGQIRSTIDSCEVVYLAESSNFTYSGEDDDRSRISEFAAGYYPNLSFCSIDQGALHAGNYKVILQNLENSQTLETVILTMNLRSFGADWIYSELETSLQKQMIMLQPYPPLFNRIRLSFRAYDIKSKKERRKQVLDAWERDNLGLSDEFPYKNVNEWDRARANGSFLNPDGSWDMPRIEVSCHFVKNYAFLIDTINNPRIKDFDDIVDLAKENNWKLVYNILAENTTKASELVEPELLYLIEKNRDILVERYSKKGVIVVDNLDDVADSLFLDRNWPTEHYAEAGRRIIAKNLADSLMKIYPKKERIKSIAE